MTGYVLLSLSTPSTKECTQIFEMPFLSRLAYSFAGLRAPFVSTAMKSETARRRIAETNGEFRLRNQIIDVENSTSNARIDYLNYLPNPDLIFLSGLSALNQR